MGISKKIRTESELIATLEAAEKRCKDTERRAQDARKSAAAAKKRLEEHRAAERQRRMTRLLAELSQLGFAMDSDDDIAKIVSKIKNPDAGCSDAELHILRETQTLIESVSGMSIRTDEDLQRLTNILQQPRTIRSARNPRSITDIIRSSYTVDHTPHQQSMIDDVG